MQVRRHRAFPVRGGWRRLFLIGAVLSLATCGGDQLTDLEPPGNGDPDPDPTDPTGSAGIAASLELELPDRMELTDSATVVVRGWDPEEVGRVDRMGFSAVIRSGDSGSPVARADEVSVNAQAGDTVSHAFFLRPDWLSADELPADVTVEIYGWAINSEGACAAAVPEGDSALDCATVEVASQSLRVGAARADELPLLVVTGRTTLFGASPMLVGDLQVDTLRERAYVSNRQSNRLHVLDVTAHAWDDDVLVGSEPWGLHLNAGGDTLLVANSGGTSVSHVALSGNPAEVVGRRLQTRNTALFEIGLREEDVEDEEEEDEERPTLAGEVRFFDFSDRPQHVAQDAEGRILYATRPTSSASLGTVRVIERQAGWAEHETRVLARIPLDTREADGTMVVMNVDSVIPFVDGRIEIWDHTPGFPNQTIRSGALPPLEAVAHMVNETSSDIDVWENRAWELADVSFADTTYVAASRDRRFVAFGDGGEPDAGRIVLWHAPSATIQARLTVADLVHNASERVRALELNSDGSLGLARGALGTYFFSNDLRLRGTVPETAAGGGGAALHPDHPDTAAPSASSATTLAFTVNADREIRILDTVHYTQRGVLPIRDAIAGPLRVTPPLPSDNGGQGRNCSGASCVVAKVYAVTDAGGVVVVDVHASDIESL